MKKYFLVISVLFLLFQGCTTHLPKEAEMMLVESVDIEQYAGMWYQVARYDHFFQTDDCAESSAEYTIRKDGKIAVLNRCWKDYYGGEYTQQVRATASPVNDQSSWLRVWFYGIFPANYLIIELDKDYQWAAVTSPNKKTLWILSRKPFLEADIYNAIVDSLVSKGFIKNEIIKTSQQGKIK
jgi:apolipoprotein D and lipocalin family protein